MKASCGSSLSEGEEPAQTLPTLSTGRLDLQPARRLDCAEKIELANALGEGPGTVIAVHLLRRNLCRAYLSGSLPGFEGAIVQSDVCPSEPLGFGGSAEALWKLLERVEGWDCVNVAPAVVPALADLVARSRGAGLRYVHDVYHVLRRPVERFRNEDVRLLTHDDVDLLESAPEEVRGGGYASAAELLAEGIVGCAVLPEGVVSIAHTFARAGRYADIGVHTLEPYRRRGYARAAASMVAERVQAAGQVPVWSAGGHNAPSLSLGRLLGFSEVSRRTYIVCEPGKGGIVKCWP
jgi:hypothetical protein